MKEELYTTLFDRIYEGRYPHGQRLKEAALASEFGVSRGPVREVLKQLSEVGLVKIYQNRGAVVVGLSHDDVEEIYEIRKSLEILALRFAIGRIRLTDLSRLRARVNAIRGDTPAEEIAEIDNDLHSYILEESGRNFLKKTLGQMYELIYRIRKISFRDPEGWSSPRRSISN